MEILIVVIGFLAFDLLALKFGVDSRMGVERDPKVTGIL